MYASVLNVTFHPGGVEAALPAFHEQVAPAYTSVEGFQHYYVVRTGDTTAVTLLLFDTQAQAEAGVERLLPLVQQALGDHVASMERHWGEVIVDLGGSAPPS